MNKLELSPRLAAIAALVPQGARLADVGTDHAYLPVRLLLDGGIASAVATDVNEGPLQRGRETAERYGVGTIFVSPLRRPGGRPGGRGGHRGHRRDGGRSHRPHFSRRPLDEASAVDLAAHDGTGGPAPVAPGKRVLHRERDPGPGGKKAVCDPLRHRPGAARPIPPASCGRARQTQGEDSPHRLAYLTDLIRRRRRALEGMERGSAPDPIALAAERALIDELEATKETWKTWQR